VQKDSFKKGVRGAHPQKCRPVERQAWSEEYYDHIGGSKEGAGKKEREKPRKGQSARTDFLESNNNKYERAIA